MRILDSKDEGDRAVVAEAPLLHEHLNEASRDFFARVQEGLARLGVAFELSPTAGARPGLLHPHRLRVHHHGPGRAGRRDGRRPL